MYLKEYAYASIKYLELKADNNAKNMLKLN